MEEASKYLASSPPFFFFFLLGKWDLSSSSLCRLERELTTTGGGFDCGCGIEVENVAALDSLRMILVDGREMEGFGSSTLELRVVEEATGVHSKGEL